MQTASLQAMDNDNAAFKRAVEFVEETNENLFLTGKAGSGKTTFLKYIQAHTKKQSAVIAPTGVAAINAGGETIHSFLALPFSPFVPGRRGGFDTNAASAEDKHSLLAKLRLRESKIKMLRRLDLLIIDEVSMVRCDLLDAIDLVLRHIRQNWVQPFGGVQMVFIGDLFQLPPVAQDADWAILRNFYSCTYFFDAHVLRASPPLYIELKKIYRQKDQVFIDVLNKVRVGHAGERDIAILNARYNHGFTPQEGEGYIVLSTHNRTVDTINAEALAKLTTTAHHFEGTVEKDFNPRNMPTERVLELKEGAQVMFIKNDVQSPRRYYNGKIGTVQSIKDDGIRIAFAADETAEPFLLEKETWKDMRYTYNTQKQAIDEEEAGSFTQYPIRLAWAVTVHKSQGLTLEKVVVDLSRSFAPGQVYVALSRCTSLEGLVLRSRLELQNIMVDQHVTAFAQNEQNEDSLEDLLRQGRREAKVMQVCKLFSFTDMIEQTEALQKDMYKRKTGPREQNMQLLETLNMALLQAQRHAENFHKQVQGLLHNYDEAYLQQRRYAAAHFFSVQVLQPFMEQVAAHLIFLTGYPKTAKQQKAWKELAAMAEQKKKTITEQGIANPGMVAEDEVEYMATFP